MAKDKKSGKNSKSTVKVQDLTPAKNPKGGLKIKMEDVLISSVSSGVKYQK